jgi:hypothetical protein
VLRVSTKSAMGANDVSGAATGVAVLVVACTGNAVPARSTATDTLNGARNARFFMAKSPNNSGVKRITVCYLLQRSLKYVQNHQARHQPRQMPKNAADSSQPK